MANIKPYSSDLKSHGACKIFAMSAQILQTSVTCELVFSEGHEHPCDEGFYNCSTGRCIRAGLVCDGTPECEDGSDEDNCRKSTFGEKPNVDTI